MRPRAWREFVGNTLRRDVMKRNLEMAFQIELELPETIETFH